MRFSERMGFVNVSDQVQLEGINSELFNDLTNLIYQLLNNEYNIESKRRGLYYPEENYFYEIQVSIFTNFFKLRIDEAKNLVKYGKDSGFRNLVKILEESEWFYLYDLIEYLFEVEFKNSSNYITYLNEVLQENKSGYRLNSDYLLIPLTDDNSLTQIDAVYSSPFTYAKKHIQNSIEELSNKTNTNYNKVINEAITAIESCLKEIVGEDGKNDSLGQLVKKLKDDPEFNIDMSFIKPFENMYGIASSKGIRHAGNGNTIDTDLDTALFVLTTCSALINFLGAKVELSE
ncbi:AbiJ-NTD4 domain-containing protein [Enterococcus casseliflavus]|uniref:AbiJ-NTD4 domain-containing protein n=1 Tax=Enterococcus casseliflavus TaxID=37734 RepID=UPI0039A498FA